MYKILEHGKAVFAAEGRKCIVKGFAVERTVYFLCDVAGGDNQVKKRVLDFVDILQHELKRAEFLPDDYKINEHITLTSMQPGDVPVTYADISALECDFGFKPSTSLRDGLRKFAKWYKEYYEV